VGFDMAAAHLGVAGKQVVASSFFTVCQK
jgi:hypothetical protein